MTIFFVMVQKNIKYIMNLELKLSALTYNIIFYTTTGYNGVF